MVEEVVSVVMVVEVVLVVVEAFVVTVVGGVCRLLYNRNGC